MGDQAHYALLRFCPGPPEIMSFVFPRGWAGKRMEAKGPVWVQTGRRGWWAGGCECVDLRCCLFLVARGEAACPLRGCSLPLRTDCPHLPPGRQHASLLRPDWPRPALNSGRLISFTKVKGARLRGGPRAQTGGPFIPLRLDWSP